MFAFRAAPFLLQKDAFSLSDAHGFNSLVEENRECLQHVRN